MPRVYARKFDWDDARRRYAAGESVPDLAREYGVTNNAVYRVVKPGWMQREEVYNREWIARGRCDDCGGPMNNLSRSRGSTRCRRCAAIALATTARDGELECARCKEWKPDEEFPHNRTEKYARRGRHSICRNCSTEVRRDYRRRNAEKERAYQREYKAKRRAEAA